MRSRTPRNPAGRPSVGPAVLLMALGGILAFGGIRTPAEVASTSTCSTSG
jgi:hypothetical protein